MSSVVFEIDKDILDNIKAAFASNLGVEVGVRSNDATVAKVAMAHEFGAKIPVTPAMSGYFKKNFGFWLQKAFIDIPQRSFMRKTVAQKAEDFMSSLDYHADRILNAMVYGQWNQQVSAFGVQWANYIKECFDTRGFGQWVGLHPITVADKGNDIPLIRTGKLRDSISSSGAESK